MSENAKQDLKEGLVLYNTDNNAGLRDAWNTIQGEVSYSSTLKHVKDKNPNTLTIKK